MRHLLKYGAGVTTASGVLLVLWQLHDSQETEPMRTYRAVAPHTTDYSIMPPELYEEHETFLLGLIIVPEKPVEKPPAGGRPEPIELPPAHLDIQIDPTTLKIPPHS